MAWLLSSFSFASTAAASTPWRSAPFAVVDLETTGLDPRRDEIISYAVVPVTGGRVPVGDAIYGLVRPRRLPDERSIIVHGILPANGIGARQQLTRDATTLRMSGVPSPDGKWIAYAERDQELWVHEIATGKAQRVAVSPGTDFDNADLAWSHDSHWLAYVVSASRGGLSRVYVHNLAENRSQPVTSARAASVWPLGTDRMPPRRISAR